jgi:hypothetical protein
MHVFTCTPVPVCTGKDPVVTGATFNCTGRILTCGTCNDTCTAGYSQAGSLATTYSPDGNFTVVSGTCQDIDGCAGDPCNTGKIPTSNGTCIDISAPLMGFTCGCKDGYAWDAAALSCVDINGCANDPCNAGTSVGSNGRCKDVAAPLTGFTYSCLFGYRWNAVAAVCEAYASTVACNGNAGYSGDRAAAMLA